MCKITRFELDEALEHIKSHAPHAHAVIEKYTEQLERELAEMRRTALEILEARQINGAIMAEFERSK